MSFVFILWKGATYMSYPYWRELIVVWVLVLLGLNHLRDGRSIIEWIRDIGEGISDVFHEFFGDTCTICGKWYFSKRKAFRCCEDTAIVQRRKKVGKKHSRKTRGTSQWYLLAQIAHRPRTQSRPPVFQQHTATRDPLLFHLWQRLYWCILQHLR